MASKAFLKAGHTPTLFASFLSFDLSFMTWVLVGPLGAAIGVQLHLSPAQKGFMVAVPVLAGAVLRVVLGLLAAWGLGIQSCSGVLALGLVLGLAGAVRV